jgi:hypothetical protein
MRIQRKDTGRNHHYIDLDNDNQRVPGVTTLTDQGMPKPALFNWSAEATAAYALDEWDKLATLPPSERLALMKRGRYLTGDRAKAKGTAIHKLAERLLADEKVPIPDGLGGYAHACADFLDQFDVRPVHVEATVYSETHRHVGTLDLIADLTLPDQPEYEHIPRDDNGDSRALLDWKTGRSGIFGDVALQLAPYRFSEFLILPDGDTIDMPEVDFCAGIHLRPDGYQLVELLCDSDTYRDFLYVKETARIVQGLPDLVGVTIEPPTASRWVLIKAEETQP